MPTGGIRRRYGATRLDSWTNQTPFFCARTQEMSGFRCSVFLIACLISRAGISAEWQVYKKTGTLEVFSEFQPDIRRITGHFAAVYREFKEIIPSASRPRRLQIILFRSTTSYRSYLQTKIPQALQRRAVFYRNGSILQIYAVNSPELDRDLRHEFTHALLHETLPYVPLWIDEGLAEYLEDVPANRGRSTRLAGMRWRCRTGREPKLRSVEQIESAGAMTSAQYRDSWAWIHFLVHETSSRRAHLTAFLEEIAAGGAPGDFSQWSGAQGQTLGPQIGPYFRRFRFASASQ